MKTRDFVQLQKNLIPHLSTRLVVNGSYCYLTPLGDTLKGFYFESSAFSSRHFYVTAFFLPLLVPVSQIHLTFGRRVGANERWDPNQAGVEATLLDAMRRELSFLLELNSPSKLLNALEMFAGGGNPHCTEAFAYALVEAGQVSRSLEVLRAMRANIDRTVPWQQEILDRVVMIESFLPKAVEEAKHCLMKWRLESVDALGLKNAG